MGKLHLPEPEVGWRFAISWCGKRRGDPSLLRDDPAEVTCQTCLNYLNLDMDGSRVPSRLRARAYGRATAILRGRHRDEFDAILAEVLPLVVEEERRDTAAWKATQ